MSSPNACGCIGTCFNVHARSVQQHNHDVQYSHSAIDSTDIVYLFHIDKHLNPWNVLLVRCRMVAMDVHELSLFKLGTMYLALILKCCYLIVFVITLFCMSIVLALMLSALKAEGVCYSPASIKRVLENSAAPLGNHDKFSIGQGVIQVRVST